MGCSLTGRRRRGPTAVGHFEETSDESNRSEVIGNACVAEQSGDGDLGGVPVRGAEHRLEDASRPPVKIDFIGCSLFAATDGLRHKNAFATALRRRSRLSQG